MKFVDNKKKFKCVLFNMSFISLVKWTIIIFHLWLRHSRNINIVHFPREIKDIFNKNI